MTSAGGEVAYAGGMGGFGESLARTSIATLVYAVARRKDLTQYKATLDYLKQQLEQTAMGIRNTPALPGPGAVPGRFAAWEKWNKLLIRQLKQAQRRRQLPGPVRPTSAPRCRSWHWR